MIKIKPKLIKPLKEVILETAKKCAEHGIKGPEFYKNNKSLYKSACRLKILSELQEIMGKPEDNYQDFVNKKRESLIAKYSQMAIDRGGKFIIPKSALTSSDRLNFTCKNKHSFSLTRQSFKRGSWCEDCYEKTYTGESIARSGLEYLIQIKLPKNSRVEGLTKNNFHLELDGYNVEEKIAFEYNGIQHREYLPFFHKSYKRFQSTQENDKIKIKFCKTNGIKLIVLNEFSKFNAEFVLNELSSKLKSMGIPVREKISISEFQKRLLKNTEIKSPYKEEITKFIESFGYKIISGDFHNVVQSVKFKAEGEIHSFRIDMLLNQKKVVEGKIKKERFTKLDYLFPKGDQ